MRVFIREPFDQRSLWSQLEKLAQEYGVQLHFTEGTNWQDTRISCAHFELSGKEEDQAAFLGLALKIPGVFDACPEHKWHRQAMATLPWGR